MRRGRGSIKDGAAALPCSEAYIDGPVPAITGPVAIARSVQAIY
ncbi:MAG: hypothetical protein WAW96_15110 [Alphaproteobacteria bacterium]